MAELRFDTVEMHTGGEPLRIVVSGLPEVQGRTILEKIRYLRENLDHIRKMLIYEPRGHYDMYGVYLVKPDTPGADVACVFIHNEGYSTMCGHAIISLGRYVIDHGLITQPTSPETRVVFQCPCGPVEAFVEYKDGKTGNVRFNSVPAYLFKKDHAVEVPGYGSVTVDVSYGGAFYALVPACRLGVDLDTSSLQELVKAASAVTESLKVSLPLSHPDNADLAFLYGTILTDGKDEYSDQPSKNVCVFADKEVDRSPTGSGVTARIAQHYARSYIQMGQKRTFTSLTGAIFIAGPVKQTTFGDYDAIVVEVAGRGHYTGTCSFTAESDDSIGKGFLLR